VTDEEIGQFITIGLIIATVTVFVGTRSWIVFRK
jgi:hypothetical protein